MATRIDDRLTDTPMMPVDCAHCGACVLARKSSWQQTSVQWNADAVARCPQLGDPAQRGPWLPGCGRMSEAIRDAAVAGRIPVPAEEETANS
ncbi:ferredoxin [Nocardia beijingensis]|uniref:ferredoxin n=1 Tax=Nocardia beijingensis TaxID=95162 RepID=UPI001894DCE7|nr:ferredoxin [Nocardia beijingensis]MBF6079528.1 ferredoxin [Nocardia beijingensis]